MLLRGSLSHTLCPTQWSDLIQFWLNYKQTNLASIQTDLSIEKPRNQIKRDCFLGKRNKLVIQIKDKWNKIRIGSVAQS